MKRNLSKYQERFRNSFLNPFSSADSEAFVAQHLQWQYKVDTPLVFEVSPLRSCHSDINVISAKHIHKISKLFC